MSLIEGVGNEVVHFVAVLLLAAVGAIAWWSTNARPDRYRIVLAMMRHHTPQQPVSLRIRTAGPRTPETSPQGGGDDVVPLQEMDSMVDADMALLDHNRLRFYRRVDSPRVLLNASESSTDESEVQEDTEPASNVQIREMDSIVSAMEADVTAGIDVFNTPRENNTNTAPPLTSSVSKDNKESQNTENDQAPIDEPNNEVQVNERKILIKLKYLNDTLKEVEGSLDELLKDFKWRHFSSELSSSRRVRLIYNGRVLIDDGATLRALGLRHRSVVHCLVHPQSGRVEERPSPTGAAEGAGGGEGGAGGAGAGRGERHWDLENILMTLVSIALTIVWFFRCEYSNMFTASASVALFGLTVFYSVAIFGLYLSDTFHFDRRQPQPIPNN